MYIYQTHRRDGARLTAYIFTNGSLDPRFPVSLSIDCRYPDGNVTRYADSTHKTKADALRRMRRLDDNWVDITTDDKEDIHHA